MNSRTISVVLLFLSVSLHGGEFPIRRTRSYSAPLQLQRPIGLDEQLPAVETTIEEQEDGEYLTCQTDPSGGKAIRSLLPVHEFRDGPQKERCWQIGEEKSLGIIVRLNDQSLPLIVLNTEEYDISR